ncbi:MAG TPA: response regulator [Candidatus Saccharibacteria bacterium]|nr:response regulator [Candidatus Saccharibacteria bacterium]
MVNTKTVLIVEDEKSLAEPLKLKLKKAGYSVYHGKNGQEGLDLVAKVHPDIILLDLLMPVMDGKEMLGRLRKDKWGAKAPVIILTNASDNTSIYEVVGIGTSSSLNDYCVKSDTSLEEIIDLIQKKLFK